MLLNDPNADLIWVCSAFGCALRQPEAETHYHQPDQLRDSGRLPTQLGSMQPPRRLGMFGLLTFATLVVPG
jgi:hypothetical protein